MERTNIIPAVIKFLTSFLLYVKIYKKKAVFLIGLLQIRQR